MVTDQPIRIAVVVSKFNSDLTENLLAGCLKTLKQHNIPESSVKVVEVPGAFELPLTCKTLAATKKYQAVIALGAVVRGETYHYEIVCNEAAAGISQAALETGVPIIFGVLTCETDEQALERLGGREGHKGSDAALAALTMIDVMRELSND